MRGIYVSYDSVKALCGIDFDLVRGEIHGLVGEHRAGKSTLVKLLSGAVTKDEGTLVYKGREIPFFTPRTAIQNKIAIVYQNMTLIPSVNSIENIFTGQWISSSFGFLNSKEMQARTERLFQYLKVDIDPYTKLEDLDESQKLMVEIAKALSIDPDLIIFDEISSRLTPSEMEIVYRVLFDFKKINKSAIYISHNMDEIFQFADRVTILKNGIRQGTEEIQDLDKIKLIKMTYSFVLSREKLERNNQELFLLKKYNENIIKNLPIGVVILDQSKNVSIINNTAVRVLNIKNRTIIDQPIVSIFSEKEIEKTEEIMIKIAEKEEYSWPELKCQWGAFISLKIFPFKDEDYKFLGTILVLEDVSKEIYFQDYLLRTEKIASIAELATGVAHEISNPLSVVLNYVDLLKRGHSGDRDSEKLAKIEKELSRIGEFIGSLLSFSKVNKIQSRPLDLVSVLDDVILLVEHRLREKSINLRWEKPQKVLYVNGNENSLKQVFVNLIINSVEATSENGNIEITLKLIGPDNYVEISIMDDGCGIPEDIIDKIFDPFFSTKTNKKNTGLGLSICQHIIEAHDGLILCSSGEKTIMSVRLPLCE